MPRPVKDGKIVRYECAPEQTTGLAGMRLRKIWEDFMKNDLFTIGGVTIHGYGLMIGLGIIAAYTMSEYRAKKKGLDSDPIISIALWGVAAGLICAKLLYYITIFDEILADPSLLVNFSDGFVVYGGIVGGIFGGWLYCKVKKLPFFKYFDLVMPAVALAQGLGRIGCFLAGCCYGLQMESPISIVFTQSDFAPNNVPLLPTQLISSGLDFLHCLVLLYAAKRCKHDGQVSALYLIFYSIGRFGLEYLRGDLVRGSVGTFSTSQFISLFILAAGVILYVMCPKLQGKEEIRDTEKLEDADNLHRMD